jgi:peptidoglycan L-alanyl-D-glutamate endopeptidase CwlK
MTTQLDSKGLLKGVNPKLVAVMKAAHEAFPHFRITEGLRTKERQAELVAAKKSMTMNSRHIVGDAVDVVCIIDGKVSWDLKHYREVNRHVQSAAAKQGVRVTWGGSWKKLVDGPHFQIEHG